VKFDLRLARAQGCTYGEILALPEDVYQVLVDDLTRQG
jgi:hypothetical protein